MSVLVNFNGSQYLIPTTGEENWGSTVSNYLADLGGAALTLTATATVSNKVLHLQSGTAAAPSLSFTADTTAGLYMPVTGQVAIATSGSQRLLVNAAGLVTIGNVALTSGTIDGIQIGAIAPSSGVFSSLSVHGTGGQVQLVAGDATHTGYVALYNAAGVRQGYIGFGVAGAALQLESEGSATGWAVSGALSVGNTLTASNGITLAGPLAMQNNTALQMKDTTGTLRNVVWVGTDNNTNQVNAGGARWRVLNKAQNTELLGSTDVGDVTIARSLTTGGDIHGNTLYTGNHIRNTVSGALWLEGGAAGYPGAATYIVNDGSRPTYSHEWLWGTTLLATLDTAGRYTTTNDLTVGGNVVAQHAILIANSATSGQFYLTSDGTNKSMVYQSDGWQLLWSGGVLTYYDYAVPGVKTSNALFYCDTTGNLHVAGNVYAANVSDERTKQQIAPYQRGLADLIQLEPISFQYNGQGGTSADGRVHHGLSAQKAQPFIPECVAPTPVPPVNPTLPDGKAGAHLLDGQLSLDPAPLVFALINAVKELNARVEALEAAAH